MQTQVSCDTFSRLAKVAEIVKPDDPRVWMRGIFVEVRNGHAWAVATNSIFAAIEYLGVTESEPGSVIVSATPEIVKQCQTETIFGGAVLVNSIPMLQYCMLKTSSGWTPSGGNVGIFTSEPTAFETWRDWLPDDDAHSKDGRAMFVQADHLVVLAASAPSGKFVFPKQIDAESPVIVRDATNPNWLGVFLARPANGVFLQGATVPDWAKQ